MSAVSSSGNDVSKVGEGSPDPQSVSSSGGVDPLEESADSLSSVEVHHKGQPRDEDLEDIDLSAFPAPLTNPDDYLIAYEFDEDGEDDPGMTGDDSLEGDDSGLEEGGDIIVDPVALPVWDVVFTPGEEPRLVIRAALLDGDDDGDDVSLVESSVPLTEDDVDRLFKLAGRVERYHSRKSKWSRRVVAWAMRRKFFAGATAFILLFLTVMTLVNIFR